MGRYVCEGDVDGSRRSTVDACLDAGLLPDRRVLARDVLEPGRHPARRARQRRPQLQNAHLPERFQVLVVDDAAAGGHPQDVAGPQQPFVTVACLALDRERHDFETRMRMRATGTLSRRKIDAIVRKHDEWIVVGKLRANRSRESPCDPRR